MGESACVFELCEAPLSPFSQSFQVPLNNSPALQHSSCCPISMKLLKAHCVLAFESLVKALNNIGPLSVPGECQWSPAAKLDMILPIVMIVRAWWSSQLSIPPNWLFITQLAYKITVGIHVEYLAGSSDKQHTLLTPWALEVISLYITVRFIRHNWLVIHLFSYLFSSCIWKWCPGSWS